MAFLMSCSTTGRHKEAITNVAFEVPSRCVGFLVQTQVKSVDASFAAFITNCWVSYLSQVDLK